MKHHVTKVLLIAAIALFGAACSGSSADVAAQDSVDESTTTADNDSSTDSAETTTATTDEPAEDGEPSIAELLGEETGLAIVTVLVGGSTFEFSGECLIVDEPGNSTTVNKVDFGVRGTGTIDGQEFHGFMQRIWQDFDGDGVNVPLHTLTIDVGAEPNRQAPPGMMALMAQATEEEGFSAEYSDGMISGRGTLFDRNAVLEDGARVDFNLTGACA